MNSSASARLVEEQDEYCPLPPDYPGIPFDELKENSAFNEAAVREVVIAPLLSALRYGYEQIKHDHRLQHPFLRIGSQNRPVELVPDYSLYVEDRFAWVLDAKAPWEEVSDVGHIAQVYSYASHPEVRAKYFGLCNGVDFVLFDTASDSTPVLEFSFKEIRRRWPEIWRKLAVSRFHSKGVGARTPLEVVKEAESEAFNYATRPLLREITVRKQQAKRHFGVHGYFTKQSWNVVSEYIRNYSKSDDVVLDPFGGSGVTVVEAAMLHRRGIHVDINPLANLMADALLQPVRTSELSLAFERLQNEFERRVPKTEAVVSRLAKSVSKLLDVPLSKDADVGTVAQLFTDLQKAQLATVRNIILEEKNTAVQKCLWLVLSSLVTKFNLTYHPSTTRGEGGGDSAAFRYYRYRIAPNPTHLDFRTYLAGRCRKVMAAKQEVGSRVDAEIYAKQQVVKASATDLSFVPNESVDYIYTDPPYGKKIAYLDLSAMWLAWLGLVPSDQDFEIEAIEGGSREKSKASYNALIRQSIFEMYRVLKFDRWMSFVFAHKDPEFWHLIIESAESAGFEYVGATPQKNGASSFKKRQHPFTVLSGQLIINFRKTQNPKAILKAHLGVDFAAIILETIESVIARYDGATIEQINDELIIKGLELGFLDLLKKEYSDLTPLLLENFDYDHKIGKFFIKPNNKFKTHVDVRLRIRYFLLSYLRRREYANERPPTFDEICLDIMPLLKNGVTPENQTILSVLETVAKHVGHDRWRLKGNESQGDLFGQ
jgi:16S rRNA G966 N2-methylase RsmD